MKTLSFILHILSLACAAAGLLTNGKKHPHLKLYFWVLAYTFVNASILLK